MGKLFSHIHEQTLADLLAEGAIRLKTVCEQDPARLADLQARYPIEVTTDAVATILDDDEIQAVIIGAGQSVQAPLSLQLLARGKYVYSEKPFFTTAADTGQEPEAVVAELQGLGAVGDQRLAVGFNKRFAPGYQDLRARAQEWGGIRHLQMNIIDDAWRWGARYEPGFLLWLDLCHWADLACWFTGSTLRDQLPRTTAERSPRDHADGQPTVTCLMSVTAPWT